MDSKLQITFGHRRTIRLKQYDYSLSGAYFITICAYNRKCLFGQISNEKMILNNNGNIVAEEWLKTPHLRDNVQLDQWIIMPNHVHGILNINRPQEISEMSDPIDYLYDQDGGTQYTRTKDRHTLSSPSDTIGAIVRGFKAAVTKRINQIPQSSKLIVWQRNYWERVIRNNSELNLAREYIRHNPAQWAHDKLYEARVNHSS